MQTPIQRKRFLQIQLQNPSQTKLNQLRSVKHSQSLASGFKTTNLQNDLVKINIPQPKRGTKEKQFNKSQKEQNRNILHKPNIIKNQKEEKKNIKHKKNELLKGSQNNQPKSTKHQRNSVSRQSMQSNGGQTPLQSTKNLKNIKKDLVGQSLAYFLGQNEFHKPQKLQQPMKTVYEWQNREIQRFVSDPNLGDFVFKLPNPDNLGDEHLKLFPTAKEESQKIEVNYQKALEFYNDIFNIEQVSKKRLQKQTNAFTIAFYFLQYDEIFMQTRHQLQQELNKSTYSQNEKAQFFETLQRQVEIFIAVLNYFIDIQQLDLDQMIQKRKIVIENLTKALNVYVQINNHQIKKNIGKVILVDQEKYLQNSVKKLQIRLKMRLIIKEYEKKIMKKQEDFVHHKKVIFQKFLLSYIKINLKDLQLKYGYDAIRDRIKAKYTFFLIFKNLTKISTFFSYFMSHCGNEIMQFIKGEISKKGATRRYFKGKTLQKIVQGDNLLWVNNKGLPKDLYTLLRNCLIYNLSQNCLFRVRTFLSKNQNYIMMVVKASQEVLEYYAQKNEISMQVEIGATDLFSFQPVDKYCRPLRLNKFIKDEAFISKYSLHTNKLDRDEEQADKSVQSEAFNLYKKAQKMNTDELRVKIILDQEQCNECFKWVTDKLKMKFINDPNVMSNERNNEQIDRQTWECYYVYNKMIKAFINRLRKAFQTKSQNIQNENFMHELDKNFGFILRIMFIKAISVCNDFHYKHRQSRSIIPNKIKNIFHSKRKLVNLWDKMSVRQPTGYFQYIKGKSFQKIWRKYQINEKKNRSKFFPAERLFITNKIINRNINVDRSIQKKHILSYYPLHDPFILKNIKVQPYLLNLKTKLSKKDITHETNEASLVHNMYVLYESKYTSQDFTKKSVQDKLSIENSVFKYFSVETVRFYCGQKIAFYFEFMKYVTRQAFPFIIPAFIIQILLWAEQTQILKQGKSNLRNFNNVLIVIVTLFNVFWTTNCVQKWKWQQKNLAQKFGVSQLSQKDEKRVTFNGKYKRNFQNDDFNFQYVPRWITICKSIFTFIINLLYVVLVSLLILEIFVFKSMLFQLGYSQSTVNFLPSLLIAIIVQICNYTYIYLINIITQFQNHKTISSFEESLISKSYIITFVITFISIFIYAFFSTYLDGDYLCIIKASETGEILQNCDYFVSSQLLSLVIVDLIFTIISAVLPYLKFKLQEFLQSRKEKPRTKFYFNKFEAIDQFYEQEDKMPSFMFNHQIDNTWVGYMNLISVFTALALFGPALPFVYVMMFFSGVVRIHASKYEIIYLTKRSIPVKAKSINWWLTIIQVVSVISIFCNIAYMIFTRSVFEDNKTEIFFFFILVFLLLKFYLMIQYKDREDPVGERNKLKVKQIVLKKSQNKNKNNNWKVDTDILNIDYDQLKLKRIAPKVTKPKVQFQTFKTHTNN